MSDISAATVNGSQVLLKKRSKSVSPEVRVQLGDSSNKTNFHDGRIKQSSIYGNSEWRPIRGVRQLPMRRFSSWVPGTIDWDEVFGNDGESLGGNGLEGASAIEDSEDEEELQYSTSSIGEVLTSESSPSGEEEAHLKSLPTYGSLPGYGPMMPPLPHILTPFQRPGEAHLMPSMLPGSVVPYDIATSMPLVLPPSPLPTLLPPFTPGIDKQHVSSSFLYDDIPVPVPTFHIPRQYTSLRNCLRNPQNITNVYIRGLHPNTTDQDLEDICGRFGPVRSCKVMMDMNTNLCRGFGFTDFEQMQDSRICIEQLRVAGYQVSYAKEPLAERLHKLEDEYLTNLYISNLPEYFTEAVSCLSSPSDVG